MAVGETLMLGMAAHIGFRLHKEQLQIQRLFNFVQKAEALTPSNAIQLLCMQDPGSPDLKDVVEGHNFIKGVGLFKGFVKGDQVISSVLNSSIQLVMSELSLEQLLSNSRIYEEVEGKKEIIKANEFILQDPKDSTLSMSVDNSNGMRFYEAALNIIKTEEHVRKLSMTEKFVSWIMFSLKLFLSVNNFGKKVSGFSIGIRRIERGIMMGQLLTIFGEFVFDRYNKDLRIVNPLFFMKDKEQMLRHLKEANVIRGRNMTMVFAIMTILSIILLKRLLRLSRIAITSTIKQWRQRAFDAFYRIKTIDVGDVHCSCCRENPRSVVFKPCLHLSLCQSCDASMLDRHCPQCKALIEHSVNIFIV